MCIESINAEIAATERRLGELYNLRRGLVQAGPDGQPRRAWCLCCGINEVDPSKGEDTCQRCKTLC